MNYLIKDNMNYLIKDEEKGKLLIYECNPIPNKIYEYRKKEIENLMYPIAKAKVNYKYETVKDKKIIQRQNLEVSHIKLLNVNKKQILLQEKKDLLESYYSGEIFKTKWSYIGEQVMIFLEDNSHYYKNFEYMLLPEKLTISSYDICEDYVYTDDIIHINEKLLLLERIRSGSMQFFRMDIGDISDQLQCFNFSLIDEIKLSTLNRLLSDKNIYANGPYCFSNDPLLYIEDRAEAGQKILSLMKN